jgi:hypothetical protein
VLDMTRFSPSQTYLVSAAVALGLGGFSLWVALRWPPAWIPTMLFLFSAAGILFLAFQPTIEVNEEELRIGARKIRWAEIRRVDQTGWAAQLVVFLTLANGDRVRLLYPGEMSQTNLLLKLIQQRSAQAMINGVPYKQIFGESVAASAMKKTLPSPKYKLLRDEDEADVEKMFQQLRTAGRIDPEK